MILRLALVPFLALPLTAQRICLAEGAPGNLQIVTISESVPTAAATVVMQSVEFLPIEITGRTLRLEHDVTRTRRVERHGIVRLELPDGGRLFRYRRNGGQHWGFLHIAADGTARSAIERPGIGGAMDPFEDRIAVDADGTAGAVPFVAGGLAVFRLDGGVYASTGRSDRDAAPAAHLVESQSPMVGSTHVFYVTDTGRLFRCGLADQASPVDVSPAPVPLGELEDQLAMSRDGQHVVFLYGPRDQERLYHVTTTGPSVVLPPPPAKYEDPEYLPEGPGEPELMLNDDGTRLFYVIGNHDELFLLDMTGVLPTLHITHDNVFEPYIGVHILPKFHGTQLTAAIGHAARMDWFQASLDAFGGTVVNLSATGSTLQPFPEGTLDPRLGADLGDQLFAIEQQGNMQELRMIDLPGGTSTVVQRDSVLQFDAGTSFTAQADVVVRGAGSERLYDGGSGQLLGALPAGFRFTPPVHGIVSATRIEMLIPWGVPLYYLPDGTAIPGAISYGPQQIVMTKAQGIVLNGATLRYLAVGVDVTIQRPAAAVRLVLSGAGG
ncbi:MAG: hypothetical protein NXI31_07080 [bacterium]|nr:hypothetical protein [bacterium]